jgi:DNA repair exonuclease SbcCD nuclease subunit
MSTNLFKRAAIFTDLHLGEKSNSHLFLEDCDRYIDWFINLVKQQQCDMILFLGDFHHVRNNININTMHVSLNVLEKLNNLDLPIIFIPGNHDLFFKDLRTISSVRYISKFKNIQLIMKPTTIDNVSFVPWLIGEEHKDIRKIRAKYIMGHFELPRFLMNAMVAMPDHGELRKEHFDHVDMVFSGHFHKRQIQDNIHYIGNAFPHNYADAGDDERGAVILPWGEKPIYFNWDQAPKYRVMNLAQLIDNPTYFLNDKTYARVNLDISISYEEANFIKETMLAQYQARELKLIPNKQVLDVSNVTVDTNFQSVDQIVFNQIDAIDSTHYDKRLLLEIYNNL